MTEPVLTEVADGVGVLTLNRPQARNAVDRATTEALAAALDEFGARVAANGPLAVRASKQLIAGSVGWTDRAALAAQQELADTVFSSADALEGARAFAEKRTPVWRGA